MAFVFEDQPYKAYEEDTIASALLANGIRMLRRHEESGSPRGVYCNIGHCFECRVTARGEEGVRACLTPVEDGMVVSSGKQLPTPFKEGDQ
nr:(2Fe-2S)-binding protein [Pseudalkalibacillus decolorationis]